MRSFSISKLFSFVVVMLQLVTLGSIVSVVTVSAEERPAAQGVVIDFDTEIMPLLTRHGCNAGSCHGAAIGRGGFKLSLLGSDAANDYDSITRSLEGRRVNRFQPERSLLLLKPSEQIGHEGGLVLEQNSAAFQKLFAWIEQRARRQRVRELVALTTIPESIVLDRPGDSVSFSVVATWREHNRNETSSNVSDWTVLTPNDAEAVTIDRPTSRMIVHRPGVHVVIARFMDRVLPIRLTVPMPTGSQTTVEPNALAETSTEPLDSERINPIDQFINTQLRELRIPSSPLADDHAFLRRVTLDLCGRLPTLTEIETFVTDTRPDRRAIRTDELLETRAFADYWALKWANILRIDAGQLQSEGAQAYHRWLADRIDHDEPFNQVARQLILSEGDSYEIGPANFSRFGNRPGDLAEHVSRSLMGVRLQCANCHNHPLDHWTQDDYHGFSAIFAKLTRGRIVSIAKRGEVTHPVTGQPAIPRIPGQRFLTADEDGREVLADWLTRERTPYLARVTVNRLWRELMGRGLVEPVDDLRATNPATHPELLEWLAQDFADHEFRFKHTIGKICHSQAYQRQCEPVLGNETDETFYSRKLARPLEAEVIADAIGDVTGIPLELDAPMTTRVVNLTNNLAESRTLDLLGRCDRTADCTGVNGASESLAQALYWINGPLLQDRVSAVDGKLFQLLRHSNDDGWVLDQLFLLTLTRPDASDSPFWKAELERDSDLDTETRRAFFEDVFWGILASQAFAANH
ncbi:DUF1549 and DUF1553 domain-containing protein [Neorhodopirellula pilleata]|uniref:Planctomycete cytochrome C n=1 Tax=Neorhodopirellula pilleata TaxID=2714738 RepID=A0A5C5ZW74_9BACT|nr:DUF1549 and DUF1553 domain-containing protein [Neorhodopirellula pilleata]TWT91852.1 hypothetical protein Pla100_48900 [Neorhodopirellula pilleata]